MGGRKNTIDLLKSEKKKPRRKSKKKAVKDQAQAKERKKTPKPVPKEQNETGNEARIISFEVDRSKRLAMWAGVSFFMLIIFVFWIRSTSQMIKGTVIRTEPKSSFDDISKDLEKSMLELEANLTDIKEFTIDKEEMEIGSSSNLLLDIASTSSREAIGEIATSSDLK